MQEINKNLQELSELSPKLYGRDFLLTWENSLDDLKAVMLVAEILQILHRRKQPWRIFDYGLAISIFRDNSTRTRFSFASAVNALGLGLAELDEVKSQIAHGETVKETATMISFLTEVIGIRDDMYPGEGHTYMKEVADAVSESYQSGVLAQRPTLVNLQCDLDHPTQSLSDLLKLKDYFGGWEALRGKKIAMSWAYSPSYGKPLSVPQGVINLMTRFGMDLVLAHPEGYDLQPDTLKSAKAFADESGGSFTQVHSMQEAFRDADVVYPKSWAPMAVMTKRTELLKQADKQGLADLEQHCLAENKAHQDWECTEAMMKLTKASNALYEHCLPADISDVSCARGEVAKSVFDRYKLHTYQQAGYKPFVIAAMILNSKVKDAAAKLKSFL
ncbi:MAG: knotted carbamoyltransferase YgeW [Candidatus Cloacimonadaceae bacterium]|jgi:knotted carbamoyltransferase YgeW|nr:knotted carbamoyltransferase YgeW [Candidatus Cloacimonadota bacterium]MDY0127318.1 knotted carbamoyltransferase YgeW [Candidatus Cloacimonadaceae bacterium]MCB5254491.1 knotted carbamoyltransferase YgeW [Candidatus Cloacimonadota bacterium]MCK9178371.1 knotted carbamoyltransferase YgeW [Candidatus Cloacimonadota bacterium]MCK9243090.1 knotted carbamoyltransferase YgeW [Candidatus Cloacimonadota bacterium]